jgi:hypothetical protein
MALPGRLASVIASANRHVQLARFGLARSGRVITKLDSYAGNMHLLAALKHRETTIARTASVLTEHSLGLAPGGPPSDHAMSLREQRRPAATQSRASTVRSEHPTTGARAVLTLADGVLTASSARPQIVSVNGSDRRSVVGRQPAQLGVVRTPAASGLMADPRRSTGLPPVTAYAPDGKATSIAVQRAVAAADPAPTVEAARLTMTNGLRRSGEVRSGAQSTARPAQPVVGSAPFVSVPLAQNFRSNQAFRPAAPAAPSIATPAFAPVGRVAAQSVGGPSPAAMRIPPPKTGLGTSEGRREIELSATMAAPDSAAAANGNETVAPTSGGPTQGDVFLDGTLVGRWMARKLAHEVGRPPSGSPAFDPTRSPFPPGRMIGG